MQTETTAGESRIPHYKDNFFYRLLEAPQYGYERHGEFYKPTAREIFKETLRRSNIFKSKKNWVPITYVNLIFLWVWVVTYVAYFFSWPSFLFAMGIFLIETHLWELVHHRGLTHRSYEFTNMFWTQVFRVLHTPGYPEEIYHFAHKCHHVYSDKVGDPYTPKGGFLYILFTALNHQPLRKDLSREDYEKVRQTLSRYVLFVNTYEQYRYWGTAANPILWYLKIMFVSYAKIAFFSYFLGVSYGFAFILGVTLEVHLGFCVNYFIHGYGKDSRRPGREFNRNDWAYNHWIAVLTLGQWHAHHHLYPNSAKTGFAPGQFDGPFYFLKFLEKIKIVKNVQDYSADFHREHYRPYLQQQGS